MSTFKEIRGQLIRKYTTNPADPLEGQMWYNSTTGTLKGSIVSEAWSSGAPLITARLAGSGFGIQTAGVLAGGRIGPPGGTTLTEEYNGNGWSASGALNTSKQYSAGAGILTAGLSFGGDSPPGSALAKTEEYNGTVWAENPSPSGDMGTGRAKMAGFGVLDSAVAAGGGPPVVTTTEEYTGTTWAAGTALSQARQYLAGAGAGIPAGLAFGGTDGNGTKYADTEEYDGSAWTAGGALNTARGQIAGCGIQTAALAIAGSPSPTATESYDGSTWTTSPATLATGRYDTNGIGTSSLALAAGGDPGILSATEEFNKSSDVVTPGAWAAGDNINTSRSQMAGGGTMTAGWIAGGLAPSFSNATEEYDGSTWSSVNNYGEAARLVAGSGPQATAFATGGFTAPSTVSKKTYDYNATTWTASADQPDYHYGQGAAGTQNAGFICGGSIYPASTYQTTTFEYDGVYSVGGTMATARQYIAGVGSQTAAVMTTGNMPAPPYVSNATEEYNSGVWSTTGNNLFTVRGAGMSGVQTAGISFGGSVDPGSNVLTTTYDGAVWSTNPSIATSRGLIGGSKEGTQGSAWMCGGLVEGPGAHTNATEEFSEATSAANIVTVTTS